MDTNNISIWNNSVYGRTKKKTMKRSQLRKLVLEVMAGGYVRDKESGKLVPHYDKFDSTKLSSIFMDMLNNEPLYSKDDAIAYIENNRGAKYYKIGINKEANQTVTDAAKAIEIVKDSPISQFELHTYGQVIQFSAPYDEKHGDLVGNFAKKGLR